MSYLTQHAARRSSHLSQLQHRDPVRAGLGVPGISVWSDRDFERLASLDRPALGDDARCGDPRDVACDGLREPHRPVGSGGDAFRPACGRERELRDRVRRGVEEPTVLSNRFVNQPVVGFSLPILSAPNSVNQTVPSPATATS